MKRLIGCIKGDLLLQVKYGFYAIYTVITVFYIVILKLLPPQSLKLAVPFVVFSDPSFLGFFFIGGLILLEKGENTLEYLVVTPLRIHEYLISKMVSLTTLAVMTGVIITLLAHGKDVNYFLLVTAILLTSFVFILTGFIAVARFQTVNEYMLTSVSYMIILAVPLIEFFGLYRSILFYGIPTQASLVLFRGAFQPVESWKIIYAVAYLVVSLILLYKWAYCWFYRFMILKEGER